MAEQNLADYLLGLLFCVALFGGFHVYFWRRRCEETREVIAYLDGLAAVLGGKRCGESVIAGIPGGEASVTVVECLYDCDFWFFFFFAPRAGLHIQISGESVESGAEGPQAPVLIDVAELGDASAAYLRKLGARKIRFWGSTVSTYLSRVLTPDELALQAALHELSVLRSIRSHAGSARSNG